MTSTDMTTAQRLQNNVIRRALSVPQSTPVSIIQMETGTYPIQALVEKKMLSYWWNIHRNQDGYPYIVVETQKEYYSYNSTWASTVEGLLNKYGITSDCRNQSKGQWKRVTTKRSS